MSKPKTEINPLRAERLNTLVEDTGLTQVQFTGDVKVKGSAYKNPHRLMTQQALSRIINLKAPLTEQTAQKIIMKYPKYRIEWLLGFDDYMTTADLFAATLNQSREEGDTLHNAVVALAGLSGFTVEATEPQPDTSVFSIINAIKKGLTFKRDGKSVSFSLAELNEFENEICDYVEMRLKRMMK